MARCHPFCQTSAFRASEARPRSRAIRSFLQTDVGIYFIGLLVTDLVYSCGFALEVLPIVEYYSYHSRACSYQGFAYAFGVSMPFQRLCSNQAKLLSLVLGSALATDSGTLPSPPRRFTCSSFTEGP